MNIQNKKITPEFSIFILQVVVVSIVVLLVIGVKFINGDWFDFLKGFYLGRFSSDTRVSEVLEGEETKNLYSDDAVQVISAVESALGGDLRSNLSLPLEEFKLTSGYGYRNDPLGSGIEFHKGIDLAAELGNGIFASADGIIELSLYSNTYGNYVVINHGNGLKTLYAHCRESFVSTGQSVKSGQLIGSVGSTGRSTGPHLHFEVIINDNNVNPEWLINKDEN